MCSKECSIVNFNKISEGILCTYFTTQMLDKSVRQCYNGVKYERNVSLSNFVSPKMAR